MKPILEKRTYKFYGREKLNHFWVEVEISKNSTFTMSDNFKPFEVIGFPSLKEFEEFLYLQQEALDFAKRKILKTKNYD